MIIAATGHRPEKLNKEYDHKGPVSRLILSEIKQVLIQLQPEKAICGHGTGCGYDLCRGSAPIKYSAYCSHSI
jgi:hypothetical protein